MAAKITYVMNVLNGEPFIGYQLASIYPYAHEIVISEGAYRRFSHASSSDGHSTDRTREIIARFPDPEQKIILVDHEGFWEDRSEMCNGFMDAVSGDVIWQVDVDEFYWPWVHAYIAKIFDEDKLLDRVSFRVREFFGSLEYEVVGGIESTGLSDVRRVHRFQKGDKWSTQRPPTLIDSNGKIKKIRKEISAEVMFQKGIFIFHPTTLFRKQTFDKFRYYRQMWEGIEQTDEWLHDTWDSFTNPLRLHGLSTYVSWIVRYRDRHPPLLEQMMIDVRSGKFDNIQTRECSDIESYLQGSRYAKDIVMGDALNTFFINLRQKKIKSVLKSALVITYSFIRSPFALTSRFCMGRMLNALKTEVFGLVKQRLNMKMRDLVPPVIYKLKDKIVKRRLNTNPLSYSSYQQASEACGSFGYEQTDLVDIIFRKSEIFRAQVSASGTLNLSPGAMQSLLGLLMVLNSTQKDDINVLDLGGACGAHYFAALTALKTSVKLQWHVVETEAMVKKAKVLETEELRFFDKISSAREAFHSGVDLIHSAGTIQYVHDPENSIKEILGCGASYLLLNRLALSTGQNTVITIQESMLSANGPGSLPPGIEDGLCRYPVTYYPKQELEKMVSREYSIKLRFEETHVNIIDNQPIVSTGYFAEILR